MEEASFQSHIMYDSICTTSSKRLKNRGKKEWISGFQELGVALWSDITKEGDFFRGRDCILSTVSLIIYMTLHVLKLIELNTKEVKTTSHTFKN